MNDILKGYHIPVLLLNRGNTLKPYVLIVEGKKWICFELNEYYYTWLIVLECLNVFKGLFDS